jgi:Fe(3+) dicitrate transport protein
MRDVAGQGSIPANEKIDDFVYADLAVYWDFSDQGRLYLGIDNFTDEAYIVSRRPFGARPGMPFQVMGGIKYQLGG